MSLVHIKIAVSFFFITAGLIALLTMLYVMGRPEKKVSPGAMRNTHRAMGVIFTVLLAVAACIGAIFTSRMGDSMSLRAVFHAILALSLIAVLLMKILIVRSYRELMRFVPAMGLIVFALALVVFLTSSGFYIVRELGGHEGMTEVSGDHEAGLARSAAESAGKPGDIEAGRAIFVKNCSGCHNADSKEAMFGPGLMGLMKRDRLRSRNALPTPENVHSQIVKPVGSMPAFTKFSKKEMTDLLAYLGTL